jgi:hypothetical protein
MKNIFLLKSIVIAVVLVSFLSCKTEPFDENNPSLEDLDTIKRLSQMTTDKVIWNDNGVFRTVTLSEDIDPEEKNEEENSNRAATCSPNFSGVDRANAKKSFSTAASTTNYTFNSFRNTLQTDTFMRSLGISTSSTSARVAQENRNVYITTSYLYAIKRESDGDYHMIIGDLNNVALTNCEASGYPSSSATSYTKIKAVRDAIVAKFGSEFCGGSSYTKFSPPILIDVLKGSLFFDVDHAAGTVGPTGFRPTTAWEIHPISELQF